MKNSSATAFIVLFTAIATQVLAQTHHYFDNDSLLQILAQRKKIESSLVLLENRENIIPLTALDTLKIASLSVGTTELSSFQQMLGNYTAIDHFILQADFTNVEFSNLQKKLENYNLIIAGIHCIENDTTNCDSLWYYLTSCKSSIIVCFQNEAFLKRMNHFPRPYGLMIAFHNDIPDQELSAQAVFGGIAIRGKLPFAIGTSYPAGSGIATESPVRLKYTLAEETGINTLRISAAIDSIVNNALELHVFPGCNVLISKDGKVIFHKAYGYQTYDSYTPVNKNDIYDLASVSKVTGALPALMKVVEENKLNVDEKFSTYWTDWKNSFLHRSNKEDLTARELLAHQAGLTPYIPFYKESMKNGALQSKWYRVEANNKYNLAVAPGLYLKDNFREKVYRSIRRSPLKNRGHYVYSDLFFILVPEVISRISGTDYVNFLDSCYYKPLGATTLSFCPWRRFPVNRIVPTETDNYFRKRQLQGSVHDESAAVLGGVSGNAGLFASANDLAKLLQMYLQKGVYGGKRYLNQETLDEFTRVQYPINHNRRGLGFDKPLLDNSSLDIDNAYPAPGASTESFGHSGYTGTFFWIDPAYRLVYIFLSNRVYPSRNNTQISDLNIRTKIQQVIYDEITTD
jgi:beta-N-acetylhexosaminidase